MNQILRAGHLPGLSADQVSWRDLGVTDTACQGVQVPVLTEAQIRSITAKVREQSALHLRSMSVSDIIVRIDLAIHRLLDANDPARQTLDAWLPRVCGLDADMVRLNLNRYLKTFRAQGLHRFVAEDLPNPKVLDEFQPVVKGGWALALGPEQLVHLWAGNVPALPLWSLVCGLLVKAGNIGKLASAEPVFATVFVQVLVQIEPRWQDALALLWWEGGDTALEAAALQHAETVIAYGGDETLNALSLRMPPGVRWLPHGHKLSFGLISASALSARHAPELVLAAAQDVVRHDQGGCYSPHVFYVQRGGRVSPREWAERLAQALNHQHARHPRRTPDRAEAAALAAWRQEKEWSSSQVLFAGHGGDVAYSDALLPLAPGPGLRCVQVVAFDHPRDVMPGLVPARRWLQTAGLAATPEAWPELALELGRAGVTRVCAIGSMTAPEAGWHHDGGHSLRDFLRWVEVEQSLSLDAERYTPYND
jgi:SAM-dependent methyltransferase